MLPFEDRYTRQRQLPEVGLPGQARLEQSRLALGTSARDVVAADYLRRAGVQVRIEEQPPSPAAGLPDQPIVDGEPLFTFAGPAAVGCGALVALAHIRSVLQLDEDS